MHYICEKTLLTPLNFSEVFPIDGMRKELLKNFSLEE